MASTYNSADNNVLTTVQHSNLKLTAESVRGRSPVGMVFHMALNQSLPWVLPLDVCLSLLEPLKEVSGKLKVLKPPLLPPLLPLKPWLDSLSRSSLRLLPPAAAAAAAAAAAPFWPAIISAKT